MCIAPMPILFERTKELFGYEYTTLAPNSVKKIAYACDKCGMEKTRFRQRVKEILLCQACYAKQPHPPEQWAKMRASTLKTTGFEHALQNEQLCTKAHINAKPRKPKHYSPPEDFSILEKETLETFGYDVRRVSPRSDLSVIVRCTTCLSTFGRVRKNLKSPCICVSCDSQKMWESCGDAIIAKRDATMDLRYPFKDADIPNKKYGARADEIVEYLISLGLEVKKEVRINGRKPYDIAVESHKIAIEFCGLHWHNEKSPSPRDKKYHKIKLDLAEEKGYRLITIFEDEWRTRNSQVKNFLKSVFNKNTIKIGARKTKVMPLTSQEANLFLTDYHLQKHGKTWVSFGLYFENNLLAALTLGHHHRQSHPSNSAIVLNRLVFKGNVSIAGGANKLFGAAKQWASANGFKKIISWSDNRWSQGNIYKVMGFNLAENLPPDYAYVKQNAATSRIPKQSRQKAMTNHPAQMTEAEQAEADGLAKIWDCGKKRWEFDL